MSDNKPNRLHRFFTDSALAILILTALSFYLGTEYFNSFWGFAGVHASLRPDVTTEDILFRGGKAIFCVTIVAIFLYPIHLSIKKRLLNNKKKYYKPSDFYVYHISLIPILFITMFLTSICHAWINTKPLIYNMPRIESITLEHSQGLSNPEEMAFIGKKGSYLVMLRIDGEEAGEITLIAESDVKSLTLSKKRQPTPSK